MRFADQPLADLSSGMAVARDGFSGNVRFPTSFSSHMRIFFSSGGGDPMLLDSQSSLNATHQQLCEFISSSAQKLTLACDCDGSPAPYEEFLKGLRISKKTGPLMLRLTPDRWLELSGSIENLSRYVDFFSFDEESGHHHPEHVDILDYIAPDSMSLIIEADSTWQAQYES